LRDEEQEREYQILDREAPQLELWLFQHDNLVDAASRNNLTEFLQMTRYKRRKPPPYRTLPRLLLRIPCGISLSYFDTMTINGANGMALKLKNNRAKAIVDTAFAGKCAIPAVCRYNIEGILATVRAVEAKGSPAPIQLFPWSVDYADGLLLYSATKAANKASVEIGTCC
jgi:hypothetical protein